MLQAGIQSDEEANMADATATTNGQELHTEDETLTVLMDADIDKVMSGLDKIVEASPSYEKLFMRWQRQHWSTEDFDFTEDAKQWANPDLFTDEERRFIEFGFSEFFLGEERVTVELLPFAIAAPTHEAQVFLTTQISDEAKHTVFWNGFYREVFGIDAAGLGDMIDKQRYVVNKDWETLFDGILHDCAERLRQDPSDFPALVRGVTTYMIVIEGMLALTAARFMIKSLKERDWFPGFTAGFTAVNRDESRHVGFGVKFLADAIKDDQANARIIEETLKECLPVAPLVFVPPWVDDPYNFDTPFYHSSEIYEYAAKSLSKKLAAMGLDPAMLAAA
jgi:ribonucleoside-diphosphate reductase beta chain